MPSLRAFPSLLLLLVLACDEPTAVVSTPPAEGGLAASPAALAFPCVSPGCDTTARVTLRSRASRTLVVRRLALSAPAPEFTLAPSREVPLWLEPLGAFEVAVRYRPTAASPPAGLSLVVDTADAAPEGEPGRLPPAELAVPLVPRVVGQAVLSASPTALDFGVVDAGARRTLALAVANAGWGNAALVLDRWDAGGAPLRLELPAEARLEPDAGLALQVTFAPPGEVVLEGTLELGSSTPGVAPLEVPILGTSLPRARLAVLPTEAPLAFGPVPQGGGAQLRRELANLGGRPLTLSRVAVTDALHDVSARVPGALPAVLGPLQRLPLEVTLDAGTAGEVAARLELASDDPARPRLALTVSATVTHPVLQATPAAVAFGLVPTGWIVARTVALRNVGHGALQVRRVALVGGSADAFSLPSLPGLPLVLERGQGAAFEVQLVSRGEAPLGGAVAVETDLADRPVLEVPLSATGASCAAACPLPHATPSCAGGRCEVGSCEAGWYDADRSPGDGCECREPGSGGDPGGFCAEGLDRGTLPDTGAAGSFTGVLAVEGDVDWLRFHGEDQAQLFSETYRVGVALATADPTIQMCVYRHPTSTPTSTCFETAEACGRTYGYVGSWGAEDGAEYYVKVFRTPGAAPTCTTYTVRYSNGY